MRPAVRSLRALRGLVATIPIVLVLSTATVFSRDPAVGEGPPPPPVRSDFNGDGFADLAVGVYIEDVGSLVDAGAVNVLYGSAAGLQATAPDDQFFTQDTPGMPGVAQAGDQFGWGLDTGDFNGDGHADLAIGATGDAEIVAGGGSETILYGSAGGLTTSGSQLWTQDSPGVRETAEADEGFGRVAAAGDINHDGYDDLAIGIPGETVGTVSAGAVSILRLCRRAPGDLSR
jgi:FG-GAP repeat protein